MMSVENALPSNQGRSYPEQLKRVIPTLQQFLECWLRTASDILVNRLERFERARELTRLDDAY